MGTFPLTLLLSTHLVLLCDRLQLQVHITTSTTRGHLGGYPPPGLTLYCSVMASSCSCTWLCSSSLAMTRSSLSCRALNSREAGLGLPATATARSCRDWLEAVWRRPWIRRLPGAAGGEEEFGG